MEHKKDGENGKCRTKWQGWKMQYWEWKLEDQRPDHVFCSWNTRVCEVVNAVLKQSLLTQCDTMSNTIHYHDRKASTLISSSNTNWNTSIALSTMCKRCTQSYIKMHMGVLYIGQPCPSTRQCLRNYHRTRLFPKMCRFYRAMLCISAVYASTRCLSVTFVTSWPWFFAPYKYTYLLTYVCELRQEVIFEIFSPSGSHTILVFQHQTGWWYSDGNPFN